MDFGDLAKVAVRTKGLGNGAFHVVNTPLSVIVHKGLGNIHKGAHDWVANKLNRMGFRVCFVAGTPIVGPWSSKAIEEYKDFETYGDNCDTLISRDEFNDDGILTVRRVLRRFERIGPVLDVVINGQRIGTTHEHPFFVQGQGWTKAHELRIGDQVRLMQPGWATVEAVEDTGRLERVYNLEIEDDHTYFVGDPTTWGFAVWAHNQCWHQSPEATGATRRSQTAGDATFKTQAEARAEAIRRHGGDADSPIETTAVYGKNPNLRGPNGEPSERVTILDTSGNVKAFDHHSNGHFFRDANQYELPHYHGPRGEHISYGAN